MSFLNLHLFKLRIHGFINHGLEQHSLYLHQGQFGCGPDFTMSLLHHHLTLHLAEPASGLCPSILPAQVHAGLLLLAGVQQGVLIHTISFLVGHPHEDIDQMLLTFGIGMKYNTQVLTVEACRTGLLHLT